MNCIDRGEKKELERPIQQADGAAAPVQAEAAEKASTREKRSPAERKARRRKRRIKKALLWVAFYAAAAVLIFCIVDIVFTVYQRKAARDRYAEMQTIYEISPAPEQADETEQPPEETIDETKWYAPYAAVADKQIDFEALSARNSDVCGWISVEGTSIDFPILRAAESDDFYLSHDIDGRVSEHGAVCMDPRCEGDFSSRVTMLYGHNMLDGSMFAPLYNYYKDAAFFDADHKIKIYLDNAVLRYRVVSAYEYGHEQPLYYYNLYKDEEFLRYCDTFLQNRDMKAKLREDIAITPENRLLTLITSTNARADHRLFVQAVLIHAE